jgi:hypothetical protein
MELDCFTFKQLMADGLIHQLRQTEKGREYLENAHILKQTKPDRVKLRKQLGGDGNGEASINA